VKRSTAIKRLGDIAEGLDSLALWPGTSVTAAHVFGPLLDGSSDSEWLQIALVVEEPAETIPWMSRPPQFEGLPHLLRLDKLPVQWRWRPASWPVWNHEINRSACFWTQTGHLDQTVIDALTSGRVDQLSLHQPADSDELHAQLMLERDVSRAHVAEILDRFYDHGWRREHSGGGIYPQDHLWWATYGFLSIDDFLKRESGGGDASSDDANRSRRPGIPYFHP
jgi:hypothetical protein